MVRNLPWNFLKSSTESSISPSISLLPTIRKWMNPLNELFQYSSSTCTSIMTIGKTVGEYGYLSLNLFAIPMLLSQTSSFLAKVFIALIHTPYTLITTTNAPLRLLKNYVTEWLPCITISTKSSNKSTISEASSKLRKLDTLLLTIQYLLINKTFK